jgi:hypothetical protein
MISTKKTIELLTVFICLTFIFLDYLSAQSVVIGDTLAFTQISGLTEIRVTSRIRTSADGSRVIFTGNFKMVYTMNSDGSELKKVFDYSTFRDGCPCIDVFIDISGDGSTIMWTDGANEIFTANFDGSNSRAIATLIPRESPFADVEPDIRVPPRLTYNGSKVFFFNVNGGNDVSGLYTVGSDGSALTQLFSYTNMSQNVFGLDGTEFNYNTAFSNYLDISDDGARGVFATHSFDISTGHTIVFNNSTLRLLRNYGPLHANKPTGIGQFSISRDGKRIAIPFRDGNSWVEKIHVMDFDGANQIELPYIFGTSGTFQLDSTGTNMLATYHLPEHGDSGPLPISIINIDSTRILDLTLLEGNPRLVFRGARSPVLNFNANTVFFANGVVRGDSVEQIWKLDINPEALVNHPVISDISFSPNYALFDKSNSSTVRAKVHSGSSRIPYVNWDTFKEGSYVFRGLRTFGLSENLVDDGTLGDASANDGIYTREGIYADMFGPPATLTVRIHADAGKYITSIDATPFFVWDPAAVSVNRDWKHGISDKYELYRNYPNPFNPTTTIEYSLPKTEMVRITIYDMLGRFIKTLVNTNQTAGRYQISWDGTDEHNMPVAAGVFLYKMQAGDFVEVNKLALVR